MNPFLYGVMIAGILLGSLKVTREIVSEEADRDRKPVPSEKSSIPKGGALPSVA
jgi:hypothetical protein